VNHGDDTQIQDLRRAHDHARDAAQAIERAVGRLTDEYRAASHATRLIGVRLEARHAELDRVPPIPLITDAITGKIMEHLESGNFEADLKTINPNLEVDPTETDLDGNQVRIRYESGPGGATFIVTVQVQEG